MSVQVGRFDEHGNLITDIGRIQNTIHELAHLIDERYYDSIYETCEVCSYFFVKLFFNHFLKNSDKYASLFKISKDALKKDLNLLQQTKVEKVLITSAALFCEDVSYKELHHTNRYIVGNVLSEILIDSYERDPKAAIQIFKEFIQDNQEITSTMMLDSCQMVGLSYNGAFDYFLTRFKKDIEKANNTIPLAQENGMEK